VYLPKRHQCRSKPSQFMQRKLNQRRKPWCNRKMCRKYRNSSEELRSENVVCATDVCSKGILLCRYRVRREANKGRLKMLLRKCGKCSFFSKLSRCDQRNFNIHFLVMRCSKPHALRPSKWSASH
jgi:hypothetical protein